MTTTHNAQLHDLIALRRSPRAFAEVPIPPSILQTVLDAARWAPSSMNAQPWRFILATKDQPETYQRLFSILKEGNQRWAGKAPVLMLAVAHVGPADKRNRHAWYDTGAAVSQMTLQALSYGVYVRQMGGFYPDQARAVFNIPDDFEPVVALALGYPAPADSLPEDLRARELAPRVRRPLTETVFEGAWGQSSSILD